MDEATALAVKAAKDAKRAMMLTLLAVGLAILVLAIDNSIKRSIVDEAQKVRGMVGRFEEATRGLVAEAEQGGAGASAADGNADPGGGGVADDARPRKAAAGNAGAGRAAGSRGKGGGDAGP